MISRLVSEVARFCNLLIIDEGTLDAHIARSNKYVRSSQSVSTITAPPRGRRRHAYFLGDCGRTAGSLVGGTIFFIRM